MTSPNPVDQPFRRLFAGFDRDVSPPADLATRLRLRVLAEAELDGPMAAHSVPAPVQASDVAPVAFPGVHPPTLGPRTPDPVPASVLPPPSSRPAEARGRRRQPWWLLAAEVAASLLLLMGAAVVVIQQTVDADRSAPRLGSSITAVASPSGEPQLLWEREDPDLRGTAAFAAGDDMIVRVVQDEHKSGFLWWERYEVETFLQSLDRTTGDLRWQVSVGGGYGMPYVTDDAVLFVSYPTEGDGEISLVALDPATGSEVWRTALPGGPTYTAELPVIDNVAFVGTYDQQARAIDLTDGSEVWTAVIGEPRAQGKDLQGVPAALAVDGDRLFTLDAAGGVVELDPGSGAVIATRPATFTLPQTVFDGRLVVTADRLITVVSGTDDELSTGEDSVTTEPRGIARISAVDRATGGPAWSTELTGSTSIVTAAGGHLVIFLYGMVGTEYTNTVRVLDVQTGEEAWTKTEIVTGGFPKFEHTRAITADGQLLYGTETGEVIALDLASGAELWRLKVADFLMIPPVVTGGLALTSDRPDHLIAIAIPEHGG